MVPAPTMFEPVSTERVPPLNLSVAPLAATQKPAPLPPDCMLAVAPVFTLTTPSLLNGVRPEPRVPAWLQLNVPVLWTRLLPAVDSNRSPPASVLMKTCWLLKIESVRLKEPPEWVTVPVLVHSASDSTWVPFASVVVPLVLSVPPLKMPVVQSSAPDTLRVPGPMTVPEASVALVTLKTSEFASLPLDSLSMLAVCGPLALVSVPPAICSVPPSVAAAGSDNVPPVLNRKMSSLPMALKSSENRPPAAALASVMVRTPDGSMMTTSPVAGMRPSDQLALLLQSPSVPIQLLTGPPAVYRLTLDAP